MKKAIIFLSIFILATGLYSQELVESFDGAITSWEDLWLSGDGTLELRYDSTLAGHEGTACLEVKWKLDVESWGGGISFGYFTPANEVIDMSARDTLSLWYFNKIPGKLDSVDFTLILRDQPSASAYSVDTRNVELWIHYVHGVYTNAQPGWHEIIIPLYEANNAFDGFVYGGNSVENNHKLDPAFIRGWYLEWGTWNTTAANTADSGVVCFDNMQLRGSMAFKRVKTQEVQDIPKTEQVKRPPPPSRPFIPIASESDDIGDDETIADTDIDWEELPPPPPPPPAVEEDESAQIFVAYDEVPEPLGGFEAIQRNLKYPKIARKDGVEGTVVIQLLVDVKGLVVDTRVVKSLGNNGCDEAAIDAIKKVKWKPATQRNHPVKVWITIPVRFKLK